MAQPACSIPNPAPDEWARWREEVVAAIRADFPEVLDQVGEDDVAWEAWRPLFDEGYSPRAAVDSAFLRVTDEA